jgi:hypothetical protein
MNEDYIVPRSPCPYCGHKMDRAFVADPNGKDSEPKPGDITLCIRCGGAIVFDEQIQFRKPTLQESREINAHPVAIQAQILIAGMKPNSSAKEKPPD